MKLGIYVGSFNPVHEGHIKVANYLLDNNYVDKVLLLPTPNYWNKQDLIEMRHRLNMLRYYETNNIIVDDIHNNYPYTYQVLRALREDYQDELYLIIGSDNLPSLDKWMNIDEILQNKIIVVNRDMTDLEDYLVNFPREQFIVIPNFENLDVSSTAIRNGSTKHVSPKVLQYIKTNHLYGK